MADTPTSLGGAGRAVLRQKMAETAARMEADGRTPDEIKGVLSALKDKYDPTPEQPWTVGSLLSSAVTGAGNALKGIPQTAIEAAKTIAAHPGANPLASLADRFIVEPAKAEVGKAANDVRQGHYSEAVGHAGAAALPIVGPTLSHIGEKIGTGDPNQIAELTGEAAMTAATPALMRMTGQMVSFMQRPLQSAGRASYLRAAKIPEAVAKRTNAYRQTGSFPAAEAEIADTVLSRNAGTIRQGNVNRLNSELGAANQATGAAINSSQATIPSAQLLGAMDNEIAAMQAEAAPVSQIQQAMARRNDFAQRWKGQADVPVDEAQTIKIAAQQRNSARFAQGAGAPPPGVSRMDMALAAEIRQALEGAVPGVAESNLAASQLRPALRAQAGAVKRAGHHNPVSLTQAGIGAGGAIVGALAGGPVGAALGGGGAALLSALERPQPLSFIGQRLYNTGNAAGGAGSFLTQANKAALLAALLGEQE